jgi:NADH-quinone oxidoreductase subunit J
MALTAGFFYLFAIFSVIAGAMVIVARNPVHAVLYLILAFFNAAGLFILLGAEFLAMILIIVYVGAVAVLFLFVVMMLDVDFAELKAGFIKNAPVGLIVGGVVLAELFLLLAGRGFGLGERAQHGAAAAQAADHSNTLALGLVLYTRYAYYFEVAGLILLVAMIGAIVLTLQHKPGVRRQSIAKQVARTPKTGLAIVKVASGEAIIPAADGPG